MSRGYGCNPRGPAYRGWASSRCSRASSTEGGMYSPRMRANARFDNTSPVTGSRCTSSSASASAASLLAPPRKASVRAARPMDFVRLPNMLPGVFDGEGVVGSSSGEAGGGDDGRGGSSSASYRPPARLPRRIPRKKRHDAALGKSETGVPPWVKASRRVRTRGRPRDGVGPRDAPEHRAAAECARGWKELKGREHEARGPRRDEGGRRPTSCRRGNNGTKTKRISQISSKLLLI